MNSICRALALMALSLAVGCSSMGSPGRSPVVRGWSWYVPLPQTAVSPPPGLIYEDVQAPLSVDYHPTDARSPKTGMASAQYFGIPFYPILSFAVDSCNIEGAARNGGIQKVDYADYHFFNILGIYSKFTVIAHGE